MSAAPRRLAVVSIRRDDGRNSHARVTAGLIAALRRAFPAAELELWSGANDGLEIESRLAAGGRFVPLARRNVRVDAQWSSLPGLGRLKHLVWLARLVADLRRSGAELVVLADYGTRDLVRWKQLERAGMRLPGVLVVLHGGLEPPRSLGDPAPKPVRNYRAAVEAPASARLHYLALAPSAAAILAAEWPALAGRLHSIDIPELLCELPPPVHGWRPGEPIRVGFVGGTWGRKGFGRFVEMAQTVRSRTPDVEFVLVGEPQREAAGFSRAEWGQLNSLVAGLDQERLDASAYDAEIARLTYVAFLGDPDSYARQASLTVVDAFRQQVPILALANPLLRDLAGRVGEIGRLFGSPDEAAEFLIAAAKEFPAREWAAQREALAEGRALFTPERAAPRLREAVERLAATAAESSGAPGRHAARRER